MICEIINPSDPYTLETENFIAAALGIAIVGGGKLGLKCDDPPIKSPVLFGWDAWIKENCPDGMNLYVDTHSEEIATALDSVLYGRAGDRRTFLDMLKFIDDPVKREQARAEYQDKNRSSLNDIGTACYKTARYLRGLEKKSATAAPIILAR